MVKFITFLRPERTLEARLNSMVSAALWDYDEQTGSIGNPEMTIIRHEHRIPTRLSRTNTREELQKSVDVYKEHVRKTHHAVLDETLSEIASSRKPKKGGITKKLAALERKKEVLEDFLRDIDNRIRIEGPYSRENYNTFHAVVPFLDTPEQEIYLTKEFLISSRYNSVQRLQEYYFKSPFGIVEFMFTNVADGNSQISKTTKTIAKKQRVPVEPILNAKGLANDIETHNWQKVRVQEELANEPEESLKKRYLNLVEAYKTPFDARELEWMDRRDFIRGIETILDANKDERITANSLINLDANSDNDLDKYENYVVTSLDCGMDVIDVCIPCNNLGKLTDIRTDVRTDMRTEIRRVKIIKVDREQIIPVVNNLFAEINPLFVYGHNQLKFDYEKSESLGGDFMPGVGGTAPLFLAQIPGGFKVLRILPGRIDIDPSGYAQHYMNLHNNRLDTVFTHVTGIFSPKTMTHDELAVKTRRAEEGSIQDAFDILYYAAQDSMKSYMIGEALKEEHILLSHVFYSLPARIDVTSKKTLGEDYWLGWNLRHKQTFPRDEIRTSRITVVKRDENKQENKHRKKHGEKQEKKAGIRLNEISFEDFDKVDYFHDELQKHIGKLDEPDDLLGKKVNNPEKQANKTINAKKGIYDGILVYFFPFAEAFREMFANEDEIMAVYNCVDSIAVDNIIVGSNDVAAQTTDEIIKARKKVRLLKAIEAICEYPLFKMIDSMAAETLFAAEFDLGFSGKELEKYRAGIKDAIVKIGDVLKTYNPINMKQGMFVLPVNTDDSIKDNLEDALKKIVDEKLGVVAGRGRFLSGTKGRFAGCVYNENNNGEFMMCGIADYASNKGERCVFEKSFYEYFLKKIVVENDIRSALVYLVERAHLLADGNSTKEEVGYKEEVEYKREAKRDHTDYSARATQRYIPRMAEGQTRKGELLKYEYNLEEMQEKFFGLPTREQQEQMARYEAQKKGIGQLGLFDDNNHNINDDKLGDINGDEVEENVADNAEKPNTRDGTISEIVEWVFKFKKGSQGRRLLEKIYRGEGTEDDINMIMRVYETERRYNTRR